MNAPGFLAGYTFKEAAPAPARRPVAHRAATSGSAATPPVPIITSVPRYRSPLELAGSAAVSGTASLGKGAWNTGKFMISPWTFGNKRVPPSVARLAANLRNASLILGGIEGAEAAHQAYKTYKNPSSVILPEGTPQEIQLRVDNALRDAASQALDTQKDVALRGGTSAPITPVQVAHGRVANKLEGMAYPTRFTELAKENIDKYVQNLSSPAVRFYVDPIMEKVRKISSADIARAFLANTIRKQESKSPVSSVFHDAVRSFTPLGAVVTGARKYLKTDPASIRELKEQYTQKKKEITDPIVSLLKDRVNKATGTQLTDTKE